MASSGRDRRRTTMKTKRNAVLLGASDSSSDTINMVSVGSPCTNAAGEECCGEALAATSRALCYIGGEKRSFVVVVRPALDPSASMTMVMGSSDTDLILSRATSASASTTNSTKGNSSSGVCLALSSLAVMQTRRDDVMVAAGETGAGAGILVWDVETARRDVASFVVLDPNASIPLPCGDVADKTIVNALSFCSRPDVLAASISFEKGDGNASINHWRLVLWDYRSRAALCSVILSAPISRIVMDQCDCDRMDAPSFSTISNKQLKCWRTTHRDMADAAAKNSSGSIDAATCVGQAIVTATDSSSHLVGVAVVTHPRGQRGALDAKTTGGDAPMQSIFALMRSGKLCAFRVSGQAAPKLERWVDTHLSRHGGAASCVCAGALTQTDASIVAAGGNAAVHVFDGGSLRHLTSITSGMNGSAPVTSCKLCCEGSRLIVLYSDARLRCFNLSSTRNNGTSDADGGDGLFAAAVCDINTKIDREHHCSGTTKPSTLGRAAKAQEPLSFSKLPSWAVDQTDRDQQEHQQHQEQQQSHDKREENNRRLSGIDLSRIKKTSWARRLSSYTLFSDRTNQMNRSDDGSARGSDDGTSGEVPTDAGSSSCNENDIFRVSLTRFSPSPTAAGGSESEPATIAEDDIELEIEESDPSTTTTAVCQAVERGADADCGTSLGATRTDGGVPLGRVFSMETNSWSYADAVSGEAAQGMRDLKTDEHVAIGKVFSNNTNTWSYAESDCYSKLAAVPSEEVSSPYFGLKVDVANVDEAKPAGDEDDGYDMCEQASVRDAEDTERKLMPGNFEELDQGPFCSSVLDNQEILDMGGGNDGTVATRDSRGSPGLSVVTNAAFECPRLCIPWRPAAGAQRGGRSVFAGVDEEADDDDTVLIQTIKDTTWEGDRDIASSSGAERERDDSDSSPRRVPDTGSCNDDFVKIAAEAGDTRNGERHKTPDDVHDAQDDDDEVCSPLMAAAHAQKSLSPSKAIVSESLVQKFHDLEKLFVTIPPAVGESGEDVGATRHVEGAVDPLLAESTADTPTTSRPSGTDVCPDGAGMKECGSSWGDISGRLRRSFQSLFWISPRDRGSQQQRQQQCPKPRLVGTDDRKTQQKMPSIRQRLMGLGFMKARKRQTVQLVRAADDLKNEEEKPEAVSHVEAAPVKEDDDIVDTVSIDNSAVGPRLPLGSPPPEAHALRTPSFFIDRRVQRQWGLDFDGTCMHGIAAAVFLERLEDAVVAAGGLYSSLKAASEPWQRNIFIENPFPALCPGSIRVTEDNCGNLRSAFVHRTEGSSTDVPVLCRWFPRGSPGTVESARYLHVTVCCRERSIANGSRAEKPPWAVISIRAQNEDFELPRPVDEFVCRAFSEQGSVDRQRYLESVRYWGMHASVRDKNPIEQPATFSWHS